MYKKIISKKNIYIFSVKYAPGLLKEILILALNLNKNNIRLILACKYKNIIREYSDERFTEVIRFAYYIFLSHNTKTIIFDFFRYFLSLKDLLKDKFKSIRPDIVIIYNPHPLNIFIFKLFVIKIKPINEKAKISSKYFGKT